MPCYFTGTAEGDRALEAQEAQENLTRVTRLLCIACKYIDSQNLPIPEKIQNWWKKHKKIDKKTKISNNKIR